MRSLKDNIFNGILKKIIQKIKDIIYSFPIFNRILGFTSEYKYWSTSFIPHNLKIIENPEYIEKIFPKMMTNYVGEKKNNKESLQVLEVGSGPASMLAWGVQQNLFQITAIDPLANFYKRIMKKNNCSYPIQPIKGYGEKLVELFERNSFDIVYSSNALDHTHSPKKCFENMYFVTKSGGIIFLEGYLREATREKWRGLHQFDIIPKDGHLLCFDRKGKLIKIDDGLKLKCEQEIIMKARERACDTPFIRSCSDDDWYIIVFRKL